MSKEAGSFVENGRQYFYKTNTGHGTRPHKKEHIYRLEVDDVPGLVIRAAKIDDMRRAVRTVARFLLQEDTGFLDLPLIAGYVQCAINSISAEISPSVARQTIAQKIAAIRRGKASSKYQN